MNWSNAGLPLDQAPRDGSPVVLCRLAKVPIVARWTGAVWLSCETGMVVGDVIGWAAYSRETTGPLDQPASEAGDRRWTGDVHTRITEALTELREALGYVNFADASDGEAGIEIAADLLTYVADPGCLRAFERSRVLKLHLLMGRGYDAISDDVAELYEDLGEALREAHVERRRSDDLIKKLRSTEVLDQDTRS